MESEITLTTGWPSWLKQWTTWVVGQDVSLVLIGGGIAVLFVLLVIKAIIAPQVHR